LTNTTRQRMNKKNETAVKLLPKTHAPDPDRPDLQAKPSRLAMLFNAGIALVTAALLAFVLLPSMPLLEPGDLATRNITSPYAFSIEVPGPDQTTISYQVNKDEIIVEAGHRVTERAARILEEIARREGIGGRLHAFAGLVGLLLVLFYLFYRDINRYRPALVGETKKILLLAILLL